MAEWGRSARRWSWVLVLLGAVLAPLAVVAVWARNVVLDTDRYVATVAPLAESPAIQDAAVDRAVATFSANVDVEGALGGFLPGPLAALAPVVAAQVESAVGLAAGRVVRSDAFSDIWEDANRAAHPQVRAILTGDDEGVLVTDDGAVVVNLNGVLVAVRDGLAERFPFLAAVPAERFALELVVVRSNDLPRLQRAVALLDRVAAVLPWVAVGLFGASVAVHPDRRRATARVGLALAGGMVVLLALVRLGRWRYLEALPAEVDRAAAIAVFDLLTRFLRQGLWVLAGVGVLTAAVATAFGPSAGAQRVRGLLGRHLPLAVGTVVGLGLVVLALLDTPTPALVGLVAGVTVVTAASVAALGRSGARVSPLPPPPPG